MYYVEVLKIDYLFRVTDIKQGYYWLAFLLAVLLYLLFRLPKRKRLAVSILLPYLFLVLAATVLARVPAEKIRLLLQPFWSYVEIRKGGMKGTNIAKEVVLNILMLMPIGLLLPVLGFRFRSVVFSGMAFSCLIEGLQLVTKRGYFEIDDIIHNTFGVVIGFLIWMLFRKPSIWYKRRE